jgi:hypothetical protein
MNACYLSQNIQDDLSEVFYRVNSDVNGNPRYVIHFLAFISDDEIRNTLRGDIDGQYKLAHKRALKLGYSKYRGKAFGGCFVGSSYNLENDAERIIDLRDGTNLYDHAA